MKKISYYLAIIVIIGGALVSFWLYQKYFKTEESQLLLFKVERGAIQEVIKVRGEVVPQKDFDLEFPFSGTIEKIFVDEGQQISVGAHLMKLETTDFELEIKRLEAILAQRQANFDKLIAGATAEDINIYKTKVENANTALINARKNLLDKLTDSYTIADDSIRNKIDQFFNNSKSQNPTLTFNLADSQLKNDIEGGRYGVEPILNDWKILVDNLTMDSNLDSITDTSNNDLNSVKLLLDKIALGVNSLTPTASLSQTTIDTYKNSVGTARTNINGAINNLSIAKEKVKSAESNLSLANDELVLREAKTRLEDIDIAKAQIEEIRGQIVILEEKIRKSVLYSPGSARVIKALFEVGEIFKPGQTAISLSTLGHKIQTDVSELDIGKINNGANNEVSIRFDAFPNQELKGRVISVDSKEIIKDGDVYYRINIYLEPHGSEIRSGMNADLAILISSKDSTLKIPGLAVYQKNGKAFVVVIEGSRQREIEIETGISDGESIEIIGGLNEGQVIAVSTD